MPFQLIPYMRQVATDLKEISHSDNNVRFYRISGIEALEEVFTNVLTAGTPSIAAMENVSGRLLDNHSDKNDDQQFFAFFIMGRAPFMDHDERERVKTELKQILIRIMSRMKRDHESDYELETSYGLRNFDINTVNYSFLPPLIDGVIALKVVFTLRDFLDLTYNPAHWH